MHQANAQNFVAVIAETLACIRPAVLLRQSLGSVTKHCARTYIDIALRTHAVLFPVRHSYLPDCIKVHMRNSLTCMLVPPSEKLVFTISGCGFLFFLLPPCCSSKHKHAQLARSLKP
jgi:hypothetical protein